MAAMNRGVSPRLTFSRGFTLTEIAIVLFIVALLIGSMMLPLAAQDDIRRTQETQRTLAEARDALIGFAVANGRFPCPAIKTATASSHGLEGPIGGGDCTNFYSGFLPAAQLGLGPTNGDGLLLDAWNQPIRYVVWGSDSINGISNPLTTTDGIKNATMTKVAEKTLLSVCATSTDINGTDCNTAPSLTSRAPMLLISMGKNGATGAAGGDEAANLNADPVFVSHDPAPKGAPNGEFDDIVIWLSPNILFNRMVAAGRLP